MHGTGTVVVAMFALDRTIRIIRTAMRIRSGRGGGGMVVATNFPGRWAWRVLIGAHHLGE